MRAHTHSQTQTHIGTATQLGFCFAQAQTFVGPPRGRGQGGGDPVSLARMVSCTLLHPVAAAGSGCSRVCRMHPANTGTRRFMHIGTVDTCVLVLLALQLLGCCCWWRGWPMLCWCPQPTLICTGARTLWLLPFVAVFCYHWCVLHCAQWLCRCASSYPCCCGAVLCVCVCVC